MSRAKPIRSSNRRPACRIADNDHTLTVWLDVTGRRPSIVGRLDKRLAHDALRHGQDLLGELLDKALMKAERLATAQRG